MDYIETLEDCLGVKANYEMLPMQDGDVHATNADISRLKAEFGFFGVMVVTLTQTPRLNALPFLREVCFRCKESSVYCMAGDLLFVVLVFRPLRISWFTVGIIKNAAKNAPKEYHGLKFASIPGST